MAESFFGTLKIGPIYRPERIIAALGMRSPDEYEAAYADTTNANLDITVKVGNHLLNSNEPGDPDTEVSARGD